MVLGLSDIDSVGIHFLGGFQMGSSARQFLTDQITFIGLKIFWLQISSLLPGLMVMSKVLILELEQIVYILFSVHPYLVGSLLVQVLILFFFSPKSLSLYVVLGAKT